MLSQKIITNLDFKKRSIIDPLLEKVIVEQLGMRILDMIKSTYQERLYKEFKKTMHVLKRNQ